MSQDRWTAVDDYITRLLFPPDDALDAAVRSGVDHDLPAISVSPPQGRLLQLIARTQGARSVLEIGTLAGYSTICLARAVGPGGRVVTLEIDPVRAGIARANFARAGLADRIDLQLGPALDTLPVLAAEAAAPFDMVFVDADKESTAEYFEWALRLTRSGSVIIVDNVVRDGAVVDAASDDARVQGVRRFLDALAAERRVSATVLQTVGAKGYDGFAVAMVL